MEGDVAKDLRTHPISQPYILEADHVTTLWATLLFRRGMRVVPQAEPSDGVVNDGLNSARSGRAGHHLVAKR
jgi:hypothetical protein